MGVMLLALSPNRLYAILCPNKSYSFAISFAKTFGGDTTDYAYSVQQTSDGGYIVAGETRSFGAGSSDAFLLKTDASGNLQWAKTFGGGNWDYAYSVQQTSDGGYIVAGYTLSFGAGLSEVFLLKTDALGNLQWAKTFGGSSGDVAYSVQQTIDGGYIVAGYTYSFGAGLSEVFLLKTDASGNLQWAKTFGGSYYDYALSVQQTSDGGYIVAGETRSFGAGGSDVFLLKTDASGNLQWAKTFGGSYVDSAFSVQQTSDGGYIVAGGTYSFGAGSSDVFLLKTDASGNLQWAKTFGGSSNDRAYSVQQTSDGGYIVAGYTRSFGAGGDVFLLKTDASGNLQWAKTFGGGDYDRTYSVQQTSDGGYIVAGRTSSFGAGSYDAFLLKTDANGNIGTCAIVASVTPTVNTPSPSVASPIPTVTSPTPIITTPSPTVTSPTLTVSEPCSLSISEEQRFDGCFADVLRVGKGHITVSSVGEFRVKVYDVSGNVVKDVEGKGVLRISLKKGVYFVEVLSREIKRVERVIVR